MIKKIYNYALSRTYFGTNLYTLICIFMALPITILGCFANENINFLYAQLVLLVIQISCGMMGYLIQRKRF